MVLSERALRWPPDDRRRAIALLVVMVAFVVLYLVVYQLHFSTSMEERIAQARYGAVESTLALHSAALYVLTLLVEDLKSNMGQSQQSPGTTGLPGGNTNPLGGADKKAGGVLKGEMVPLGTGMSGGGGSKWYDHIHKNIFSDNQQQVGNVTVKITITDGERAFDLNRLFDYVRLPGEELTQGLQDLREEDVASLAGKDATEAGNTLKSKLLKKRSTSSKGVSRTSGTGSSEDKGGVKRVGSGETPGTSQGLDTVEETLSEYDPDEEFELPDELRVQATRDMVERAILMMFSVNENEYGYRYSVRYNAREIAMAIVDYVLDRRSSPAQNRIYVLTELLNVPGVTREVFYGPTPELKEGEDFNVGSGFVLRRDEFGDVVPQYVEEYQDPALEEQKRLLEDFQRQFGQFKDFPGLGRLKSNALTRGMSEAPVAMDDYGYEYTVEVPRAIGLKDIFTTYSTGKININTASVPVLFGLLLSLTEDEANNVVLDLRDYRNRFQEEVEQEGVRRVGTGKETPDLGQPKRVAKDKKDSTGKDATGKAAADSSSSLDATSLDDMGLSTYQDLETNYFTRLDQLELIDGTDGDPMDRLRRDEGVERVDAQEDTLFRRVVNDLEKVAVFGSTYFNAELKAKTKEGATAKAGSLTVRRDPTKKRIEILMWKNLQK